MKRTRRRLGCLALVGLLASGCAPIGYYAHLGKGSLALVGRGERVERLLRDPATPAELAERLRFSREVLAFAESRLALPVGKKYGKYVNLGRDYVVWTVVAAPEFSLEPKTWCFPIAGCVAYRGYFAPGKAERFARRLEQEGLDVSVGGVRAFSFLGWFADPLLDTFLFDEDRRLAALLFHELAHGLVYAPGDTAFNESFASAVEREAMRRFLSGARARSEAEAALVDYERFLAVSDRADSAIEATRNRLEALYRQSPELSVSEKRERKADLFAELRSKLAEIDPEGSTGFAAWVERDLGNADLASVGFYREHLPAFEDLLAAADHDLERFYAAASCLAALDPDRRSRRLESRVWRECILAGSMESR